MVTSSNISFTIDSHKRSFSILCQGINLQLADNVMTTHTLYVLCKDSILFCNLIYFLHYLFFFQQIHLQNQSSQVTSKVLSFQQDQLKSFYAFLPVEIHHQHYNGSKIIKRYLILISVEISPRILLTEQFYLQLNPFTKTMNNSVQSEINIIANITDNKATYKCEAKNSATDVASIAEKTLSVHCKFTYKYSCCFYYYYFTSQI